MDELFDYTLEEKPLNIVNEYHFGFSLDVVDRICNIIKEKISDEYMEISLDLNEFLSESIDFDRVQASLLYAEENAEGYAYDVAYNLRMNGCIVELYTGCGRRHN